MSLQLIHQPDSIFRLGDFLKEGLQDPAWTEFRAAIAFVKYSGAKHIAKLLSEFSKRGIVRISVGIDAGGTSVEGLSALLDALENRGEVWIFHNANYSTFHPKVYLFKNDYVADVAVGSGNLTEGGLFTNYEASIRLRLDLSLSEHLEMLKEVESLLDTWSRERGGLCYRLASDFLATFTEQERVPSEDQAVETEEVRPAKSRIPTESSIFRRIAVPSAPSVFRDTPHLPQEAPAEQEVTAEEATPAIPQGGYFKVFLMTLQKTDVGVGQTTAGASRRSPEIFIPLAARDADPDFWGWPTLFMEDANKPGKMDRHGVKMRIGTEIVEINMMTWPDKHDFRLRSEQLRSAGGIGDILRIERSDGLSGFTYYVEVIPNGTSLHADHLALCVNPVRNSGKLWGYF